MWEWFEQRWAKITARFGGGYGDDGPQDALPEDAAMTDQYQLYQRLSRRRLEALSVARTMTATEVDASAVEAFEPEELQHVN